MTRDEGETFIRDFMRSWEGGFEAIAAGLRAHLKPDCVWKNSGLPDVIGPEAAIALQGQAREVAGIEAIRCDVQAIAVDLPFIVAERTDHLLAADGRVICSLPVLGIFRMEGRKIAAWHDYTDPAPLLALMPH